MALTTTASGARASTATLLSNGSVVQGRYQVLGLLGQGGMGGVYEVSDLRLGGRRMALKVLSDAALDPAVKAQAAALFRQEAELLARLDHPNIPNVTDFFVETGRFCLVMELVDGMTLAELQTRRGRVCTEAEVRSWTGQLCTVLDYLHRQNPPVIFRDLKPANIMLSANGQIKLIDFGIARLFKGGQTGDTQVIGTPGYAAPEQYGVGQTDVRSDIYSLGVVMHHLLTGHDPLYTPFNLPPASALNPGVSPELTNIIATMTRTDPGQRFQNVGQVRAALQGAAHAGAAQAGATQRAARPTVVASPKRGRKWLWAGVAALVLVIVAAGALALSGGTNNAWTPQPVTSLPAATSGVGSGGEPPRPTSSGVALVPSAEPTRQAGVQATADAPAAAPPTRTAAPTPVPPTATRRPTATEPPTKTPLPTNTPAPTATPRCPVSPHPNLAYGWDRGVLGCPLSGASVTWAAWEPFERGYMLWRLDNDVASALYNDGGWVAFPEKWDGNDYSAAHGAPPAGLQAPQRGFAFVWGRRDDVFNRLGWAVDQEKGICALVQEFEQGFLLRSQGGGPCYNGLFNWATDPSFRQFGVRATYTGSWSPF